VRKNATAPALTESWIGSATARRRRERAGAEESEGTGRDDGPAVQTGTRTAKNIRKVAAAARTEETNAETKKETAGMTRARGRTGNTTKREALRGRGPRTKRTEERPMTKRTEERTMTKRTEERKTTKRTEERKTTKRTEERTMTKRTEERTTTKRTEERPMTKRTGGIPMTKRTEERTTTKRAGERPKTGGIKTTGRGTEKTGRPKGRVGVAARTGSTKVGVKRRAGKESSERETGRETENSALTNVVVAKRRATITISPVTTTGNTGVGALSKCRLPAFVLLLLLLCFSSFFYPVVGQLC